MTVEVELEGQKFWRSTAARIQVDEQFVSGLCETQAETLFGTSFEAFECRAAG